MTELPQQAQVVIIGGGVIGCSVAYHLTQIGWTDVVLLERKKLTSGTTWHAAGLVGQLRATYNLTRLAQYTTELYASLEQETGQSTGFRQNGSLAIASDKERFEEFVLDASMASRFGPGVRVVSLAEVRSQHPASRPMIGSVVLSCQETARPIQRIRHWRVCLTTLE